MTAAGATEEFRTARDFLIRYREEYEAAYAGFVPPRPDRFNWALEWFDVIAEGNDRTALHLVREDGTETRSSFAELSARSNQVANWLRGQGVRAGDRIVVMLGDQPELWETALAAMKLRAVVVPVSPCLDPAGLRERMARSRARHVVVRSACTGLFAGVPGDYTRVSIGGDGVNWLGYELSAREPEVFEPDGVTLAHDTLMLCFTADAADAADAVGAAGAAGRPELVEHTHTSLPVGHLSTMYGMGLLPGDVHLDIAPPDRAEHAWSTLFAAWNAEATVLVHAAPGLDAGGLTALVDRYRVTSVAAPPAVWRRLVRDGLGRPAAPPREAMAVGAGAGDGEPSAREVAEAVGRAWGVPLRGGFGRSETTVLLSDSPGSPSKPGSLGRPAPGCAVTLIDPGTGLPDAAAGEICLDLATNPVGLMTGYHGDPQRTAGAMAGGHYRTGDLATRDEDGHLHHAGRAGTVLTGAGSSVWMAR